MNEFNLENEAADQRDLASHLRDGSSPIAPEPPSDDAGESQPDDKLQVKVEGNPLDLAAQAWPVALALAPFVLLAVAFRWLYLKLVSSARQDAIDQDAERRR